MKKHLLTTVFVALSAVGAHAATLIGDNQSGLEFGYSCPTGTPSSQCVGKPSYNYVAPDPTHAIVANHARIIRLPFLIERAQPTALGDLDTTVYLAQVKQVALKAIALKAYVVLDPHNYGYVYDYDITSPQGSVIYLDFEKKFSAWVKANFTASQMFYLNMGLMNEPFAQSNEAYQPVFQAAINEIRASGFPGMITYPATAYSGMTSISVDSTFMSGVVDPKRKTVAEFHEYWDAWSSGTQNTCITDANLAHERMDGAIAWSKRTGIQIFWGETGEPEPAQPSGFTGCYAQSDALYKSFIKYAVSSGRFVAITPWGDGPWWGQSYLYDLYPVSGGADTAAAQTLKALAVGQGQ